MWQRMKRRPQLALVAAGGIFVLIVAILAPVVGPQLRARLQPPASAHAASTGLATPQGTIFPASSHVHATWSDSTALVKWDAISGATGYVVTLIRSRDLGIIERYTVPATQRAGDAQGVWPNESYQVAIQPLQATGTAGTPEYSAPGQSVPISRQTYNGFLDQENRPAGPIDANLWDEHLYYAGNETFYGDTFVNDQLHYHLVAGCPMGTHCAGQQTITTQEARVPIDWTNRTATIHGEVDLKGDQHQWFGAVLSPQLIGPDRVLDEVDRFYAPVTMPQLEVFTFQGRTRLIYAAAGQKPQELASIPNPVGLNNVRDELVWHVSATHTTVTIDGQTAFDLDWPAPLAFTHGYLSLFAEDYPNSGGTNGQPTCDQAPTGECSVWHLDNWGFDAPAGQVQPTSTAYYAQGCGPYAGGSVDHAVQAVACNARTTNASVSVPGVATATVTGAMVVFEAQRLHNQGALTVAVNGHTAHAVPYIATERNTYNFQSYAVTVPASELVNGTNTVSFSLNAGANNGDQAVIANVQIETLSSVPYAPPLLPPDPAPQAYWR